MEASCLRRGAEVSYLLENRGVGQRGTKGRHIFSRSDRDLNKTVTCRSEGKSHSYSKSIHPDLLPKIQVKCPREHCQHRPCTLLPEVRLDGGGPSASSALPVWSPEAFRQDGKEQPEPDDNTVQVPRAELLYYLMRLLLQSHEKP